MDSRLTWEPHVSYLSGRLSRVIYLLRALKNYVPVGFIRSAYYAFFHSLIAYGIVLWGNCSHVKELLLLQKKAVRIIANVSDMEHCKPLFVQLGIMTVVNLYIHSVLLYTKTRRHELQDRQDAHGYNTRRKKNRALL